MPAAWKHGWQENAFLRCQPFIAAAPGLFARLSPADAAEDAYLLGIASTLYLRDELGLVPPRVLAPPPPAPAPVPPVGMPPFAYERVLASPGELAGAHAAALAGQYGAFHREAAARAGAPEAWAHALHQLYARGALRPAQPPEPPRHAPPLPSLGEELQGCVKAVLLKAVHALKIGFGLWGRWEAA